ncbi:uncharacterized protein LOC143547165 [Bidens hawaiensis]|uniref:uncharacterized protein LOC143547165 n=1 Tax=Bidens hawaiensis TaxID=980011 RepID=UPI00404B5D13
MREFFAYRIQDRDNEFSLILISRRLYQQFLVDGYTMIESERLFWVRHQQKHLRCETYENLRNLHIQGNADVSSIGTRVILPSSFTGGARYMMQNYLDAMALFVYTVEFQKRGLPHAHLCLFLHPDHKLPFVENVDQFICAEIPDEKEDPTLYSLVKEFMMHGPCEAANLKCSCMIDKRCSKNFPKKFSNATSLDSDGFPIYRRRDSGSYVERSNIQLDNRSVVPYNKELLKRYQAHINVEWCNQAGSIKYLFKYINKGPDRATVSVVQNNEGADDLPEKDEIKEYYDCVKHHGGFFLLIFIIDDDSEYIEAIQEASQSGSGFFLRNLFAYMLMSNSISRPEFVWEKTWEYLSDNILYQQRSILNISDLSLTEEQLKNLTLYEIEKFLLRNNYSLRRFSTMPYPDNVSLSSSNNRLISQELSYDIPTLQNEVRCILSQLTAEQRLIYDDINRAIEGDNGGVFFVYGYGGTGKTFLWKTLSASIRSKGEIVLNVASSGIASLLLPGERTAHLRFGIPINFTEVSSCGIKKNTEAVHLLKKTKLIIWDEAPMTHKHAFEALDRTLKDMLGQSGNINNERPFGGKVVVFGGDFRQTLPVIQGGTRQEIVNASLCSSYLWGTCKVLKLTKNMRLTVGSDKSKIQETKEFANWLLDLGEGKLGGQNDGDATFDIPNDLLIKDTIDPISQLIDFVYPSILKDYENPNFFSEGALLAPTNEVVEEVNDRLLSMFPGKEEYLSSDSICPDENVRDTLQENLYSPDVLNGLKISGMPNHKLVLKVGVPIMLLRNVNQKNGLCNGTRLHYNRFIEVVVISGTNIGDRTYISRSNLIPTDKKIPFRFQRRQFPVAVCFAMTVNKSQGQSLSRVGLFLRQPVFAHGQLYVALSRVTTREGLKVLIFDEDGQVSNKTTNFVYKEIFRDL